MRTVLMGMFLVAFFCARSALAQETVGFANARVQIMVPQDWKSVSKGNVITLSDRGDDVAVAFAVVPAGALKKASQTAGNALRARIQNLTFKKEERVKINGMPGVSFEGDGIMNGVNIDLAVLILDTPAQDKDLFIFALAEDAKLAAHKSEVKYVLRNIAPAE
jgi:hypothetical protein